MHPHMISKQKLAKRFDLRTRFSLPEMSASGFSLMELTIGLGILALVLAVISASSTYMFKRQAQVNKTHDTATLMAELRRIMANQDKCTRNFSGLPLPLTAGAKVEVSEIANYSAQGTKLEVVASPQAGGITSPVSGLTLIMNDAVSNSRGLAELVITTRSDNSTNSPLRTTRIPVAVNITSGKISSCSTGDLMPSKEQLCSTLGERYNPNLDQCGEAKRKCYQTSTAIARCPTGYPPDTRYSTCSCIAPQGFLDPARVARDYNGVMLDVSGPSVVRINYDRNTQTCTCHYGLDIDKTGWQTQICCLVDDEAP